MQRIVSLGTQLICISTLVGLFISCTKDEAADKNTLVVAISAQPSTLDPRIATDAIGMRLANLMFNSLVQIGPDLRVIGDAAQRWNYEDLTYTFYLHPNLSFSSGRTVTKEDILFSFEQFQSKQSPFRSALETIKDVLVEEIDGQLVVHLKLSEFSAKLLNSDLPVVKILPKPEVLAAGDDFSRQPVGSGSFVLEKQNSSEIILKARSDHPFRSPKIKNLVFKIIRDDFTRYQRTLKGSIDIVQSEIPLSRVSDFIHRSEEFEVHKYPGLSMTYILLNLNDPLLKKKTLRQAISQGINRQEIIQYKLEGFGTTATSLLTPGNPYFFTELSNPDFDPAKAKRILDDLNIESPKLTLKTSNNQSAVENGRVIAHQLRQIGLDVQLQSFEWATFYGDIQGGNFQMATMRWIGATDPDIYRMAFHSQEKPPGRNRSFYANPKLDQLLEAGLHIADEKKRIDHYKKVQRMIQDDFVVIPLWYDEQVAIVNKRVQGYIPSQTGDFSPFINVSKN